MMTEQPMTDNEIGAIDVFIQRATEEMEIERKTSAPVVDLIDAARRLVAEVRRLQGENARLRKIIGDADKILEALAEKLSVWFADPSHPLDLQPLCAMLVDLENTEVDLEKPSKQPFRIGQRVRVKWPNDRLATMGNPPVKSDGVFVVETLRPDNDFPLAILRDENGTFTVALSWLEAAD